MELLTPDGWSQAYRMEAVILQTMATMIKGVEEDSRGRADPTASPALPGLWPPPHAANGSNSFPPCAPLRPPRPQARRAS